jgi:hypothetical protein
LLKQSSGAFTAAFTALVSVSGAACSETDLPPAELWSCVCRYDLLQAVPPALGVENNDWVCGPAGYLGEPASSDAAVIAERGCAAWPGASNCVCLCEPLGEVCDEGVM